MPGLSSLYGSPQRLPSVDTVFNQNRNYLSSETFQNRSTFICEESLQESPSTSHGFFPLREIQPGSSRIHANSGPTVVFQHYSTSHKLKPSCSPSMICSSRKRRFLETRLNTPKRSFVSAKIDRLIHGDEENLRKLLKSESDFLPNLEFLKKIQKEISLDFRKSAVVWLEEVCLETGTDAVVFPLAISYMDRFLSLQFVPKINLQHLASACLLLAGKVKAPIPLKIETISKYTDGAVSESELVEWELLVISTLNWQFLAPTAFEFLDQLLTRSYEMQEIREPFRRICYRLQQDETLAALRPSLQAIFCAGFAAIEFNDDELFYEIEKVCTDIFNVPVPVFRTGVNRVGALFCNVPAVRTSMTPTVPYEDIEVIVDSEGSPRKIRRISEEPENTSTVSPGSSMEIEQKSIKLNRSKSAVTKNPTCSSLKNSKSYSASSLRRTSVSDDSGFQSEMSSPDVFTKTTTTVSSTDIFKTTTVPSENAFKTTSTVPSGEIFKPTSTSTVPSEDIFDPNSTVPSAKVFTEMTTSTVISPEIFTKTTSTVPSRKSKKNKLLHHSERIFNCFLK